MDRRLRPELLEHLLCLIPSRDGEREPRRSLAFGIGRRRHRHRRAVTDGPFTESKELIGSNVPPNAARH
jgi:hypothetical protein